MRIPINEKAPELLAQSEACVQQTKAQCSADPLHFQYPAHDTQAARLLAVSLAGEKVNPLYGWKRLGIYRLSDTKFRLKQMGWPFFADRLGVANRFGESCHVALYGLAADVIAAAGEAGQEFARKELALMSRRAG